MFRSALLTMIAAAVLMSGAPARAEPPPTDTPGVVAPGAAAAAPAAHFDADAATAAYLATRSPEAHARSEAYFEGGYWLILWDFLVGLGVAAVLLATRLSARMRDFAERVIRFKPLQTALYGVQYFALTTALSLPWSFYEGYVREHQYGMSNQTPGDWLGDELKGFLLVLLFGTLALMAIYGVIRKAPKTWWLWGSIVAICFIVFQVAVGPTYLEPVFNKFYPVAESPLKQQILSLARANAIPVTQLYEFDASKQTTKMSAHVSGMFGSAQISMNDNLMNRASPEEIKAVLGHEMGHYVMNHIYKGILSFCVIIVIGFGFLYWGFDRIAARTGARWQIRGVDDVAGLPVLVALFSVYFFILTPVVNTDTRVMEAEADAFGLNAARQPDGFAQMALHLSEYRKLQPGTLEEIIFFDHPSGYHRIHRGMVWKAENLNAADIAAYDASHHPPGMP